MSLLSKSIEGKAKDEQIAYLKTLPYTTSIKEKNNKYYLVIPELAIVSVHEDLNEAYKDVDRQKAELFEGLLASDSLDDLVLPRKTQFKNETIDQLKIFGLKVFIICFLFGGALAVGGSVLLDKVAAMSGTALPKKVVKGIVAEIERIGDAPPAEREKKIKKMKNALKQIKPIIQEIQKELGPTTTVEETKDKRKRRKR